MILTVTVKDPSVVDWFIPVGSASLPPKSVTVGDTIQFRWTGTTTYTFPQRIMLRDWQNTVQVQPRGEVQHSRADPANMLFVCDVGIIVSRD
jgi:hypothetical protein